MQSQETNLVVDFENLSFSYNPSDSTDYVLRNITMKLPPSSRCLLIGANGAGKSTLLRILGGKHMVQPANSVKVLGYDAFRDLELNQYRAHLDTNWGMRTVAFAGYGVPLQADIPVYSMMSKLQETYQERRDELVKLLGINLNWRMHMISDGQRRRVQLLLGLIRPFKILLLDEVTVSLDVVVRQDLLMWLRRETEVNGATIIYATHIFDGLDDWPTHVHFVTRFGETGWQGRLEDIDLYQQGCHSMLKIAEVWLRKDMLRTKTLDTEEKENGENALEMLNPLSQSFVQGGGFAPGRMNAHNFQS